MKHFSFALSDKKAYGAAKKAIETGAYKSQLIQLFCGILDKEKVAKKIKKIVKEFPDAVIIGASSAGEIAHAKMYENEIVVSLSLFEKTKLKLAYSDTISKKSGISLAKKVLKKDTKAIVVLGEGLKSLEYETFLNGMNEVAKEVIIAGGLAGDKLQLKETFIIENGKIHTEGAVALSFSSKKLYASNEYNLNWIPIGKEFVVTKASGKKVFEIDNTNVLEFFKKYLGEELLKNAAIALPNFQLLAKEGAAVVARTPLMIEGDGIVLASPINENQVVQIGFSNEALVLEGAYNLQQKISHERAEAIYVYSCIARKTLLQKTLEREFSFFESLAPTAGFFTYGEFYSTKERDILLNCTTTMLILSERREKLKKRETVKKKKDEKKTLEGITFNALAHFIKQTSLELKENVNLMNQYKDVVDTAFLVSKTDKKGVITYVNENFCQTSQYTKEELLGKSHNIVRDPTVPKEVFKEMWQTIEAGKIWKGSFSNLSKDKTRYYVDTTIMPIFDAEKNIVEYIAIRQDITKDVVAREKMREKENLIHAIFDNQDSIVIHASKTKGMQSVNKKLFEYFDYKDVEDFQSRTKCICDLFLEEEGYVHPKTHPNWLEDIAHDEEHDYKVKMRTKTGSVNTFTIRIKKIADEYIINLYDITKLEEALLKAHSSERAKSLFLANMSHEIRTPLNGILGFTDVLMKKELDSEAKRYVDIIHKSGETLLNVVNDILDFSKIESGELTLYETETNLFTEMEAAVATFASVAKKKNIEYYTYIDTAIPKLLRCDIQRIKQVMNNLVSNALKFTPEGGEVDVEITLVKKEENKAKLHFSVRDSGIGIAKNKIKSIFSAFSQADNSISRKFGGTGLGLAISQQYIHMMNSEIKVESEVKKGSEFFFDLELEILEDEDAVRNVLDINNITMAVLNRYNEISCGVNTIVYKYLDAWNFHYSELNTINELEQNTDILIICAKLIDVQECEALLRENPTLNIIYILGSEKSVECQHERFYAIEQPMTGSVLFDLIVHLVGSSVEKLGKKEAQSEKKHYGGKILIAEDNETNQMLVSIMLDERGIEYTIVQNGQEAVDAAMRGEYDLILMDINMPILDGVGATKMLREYGYTKPIVSLSANVIESDTRTFKEAGIDDTLNKPLVPKELDALLEKYLLVMQEQQAVKNRSRIDIKTIAEALHIENEALVKSLLLSLQKTLLRVKEELQEGKIDEDLLHKLKGAAGNMRVDSLYKMTQKFESAVGDASSDKKDAMQTKLLQEIDEVLEEIAHIVQS